MFSEIKKKIDKELFRFIATVDRTYSLKKASPLLFANIKDFALRDGKRLRPVLFIFGYLGFSKKEAPNLYTSALAIELIHDFMLIHDDIVDKSDQRRGKPSIHKKFNVFLSNHKNAKFNGQDLAMIAGDILYCMGVDAFLSVKEVPARKEKALRQLLETATYTGCGQFIELLNGIKHIEEISKHDIYQTYDYKTARYTFACPLSMGAILAGAAEKEINHLFQYGLYLGRAFQIKDDILSMFGNEKKVGKSTLSDLREGKKTLLMWYAYHCSDKKQQALIREILLKRNINKADLLKVREIVKSSGALDLIKKEIETLQKKAQTVISSSRMRSKHKNFLSSYSKNLLSLENLNL